MAFSLDSFRRFIDVPNTDPDDRRRARLLTISIIGMGIIGVAAIVLITIMVIFQISGWYGMLPTLYSAILFLFFILVIFYLVRRGRVNAGSVLFLILLTLAIVFAGWNALASGGTIFYFVIPVILASVLLRPHASFIVAAIIALLFALIMVLQDFPPEFMIGGLGMFAIAFISWLSARSLERALFEVRTINEDLDRRVLERTEALAQANRTLEDQARELARVNITLENQALDLSDANQRLQSLDQLKSKFVSDVTHELRTPINNLMIYMEMLKAGKREKLEQYLDILHEEAHRLSELVEDVLDLSRMELGRKKAQYDWIDINALVELVVLANEASAESKGLEMSFDPAKDLPKIMADSDQTKQIMNNLIANAINYTKTGKIQISTWYNAAYKEVCIRVEDTGMGIHAEDIPHLFERFYRGQQASQSDIRGTGLGLAIVKEIVEQHGGRIKVESQVAVGTRFIVSLPIQAKDIKKA